MSGTWSMPVSPEEAARRAGGRRKYNRVRQAKAFWRRVEISRLMARRGAFEPGYQAELARKLGVSRSTVCRDMKALAAIRFRCPECDAMTNPPPKYSFYNI